MATTPAQAKGMSDIDPRPPFPFSLGLGSITYSRVLASERYRLTLNSQVGSTATRGSWRISPGVSPEFACTLYVEDLATGSSVRLSETDPAASERWTPGSIIRQWQALDAQVETERLVDPEDCAELFIVRVTCASPTPRSFRVTLLRDLAFDHADGFDSHPVFSKLFLQTRLQGRAILVSRRPRSEIETHPSLAFLPILPSSRTRVGPEAWYDTDRSRILGRTLRYDRDSFRPELAGTCGNVLDPMLAVSILVETRGSETTTCGFVTAVVERDSEVSKLEESWSDPLRLEHARRAAADSVKTRVDAYGITYTDSVELDSLGAAIARREPALRATRAPRFRETAHAARSEQSRLAAFGVTPQRPLLLARWTELTDSERLWLGTALRYWSGLGLGIHAVLIHDGVRPDLPDSVSHACLLSTEVSAELATLFDSLAAVTLPGDATSANIAETTSRSRYGNPPVSGGERRERELATLHHELAPLPPRSRGKAPEETLEFDNGFGAFAADGTEYLIRLEPESEGLRLPPRPWTNVLANRRFGCLLSETGAGSTWFENSREHRITPWRNDPVLDPHDEAFYLLDEVSGERASVFPGPIPMKVPYEVRHGFGYTTVRHGALGLETEAVTFVAERDPYKVTRIRIHNPGPEERRVSVMGLARLVMGPSTGLPERHIVTEIDPRSRALLARNPLSGVFANSTAFATAVTRGELIDASYTCDLRSALGDALDPADPAGLRQDTRLDGTFGAGPIPCFAQKFCLTVGPQQEVEVSFVLGAGGDETEALALASGFADPEQIDREFDRARAAWRSLFRGLQIETPSRELDILVNGWLPYQTQACRIWGRSAFYQSGGAYGFRDQLQDSSSLLFLDPARVREQICLHASHQFVEGDVLHWWHPPADVGIRTRFVDDLLWLPLVTGTYIEFTGDGAVLNESLPFLAAPLLEHGEAEAFLQPSPAGKEATLYEHCCLAIDRSLHLGPHGLPLFGAGDWNDGMNRVGIGGTGESVWMGFFLVCVFDAFLPYVLARGDSERAARYESHRAHLVSALNTTGWDGDWYKRGYYDDGAPLGSKESDECKIDALAQAWAVLSGVAPPDRARNAMSAAEEQLVSERDGIIRLLAPAFENSKHDPGYIKGYVAGVRENGGQYTHAALWFIRALAKQGRTDRVSTLLEMIGPIHHTRDAREVERYQLEPYVVAADIYGVDPHVGRGGWSWYTGSSGWMSRVVTESLLGLSVRDGRELRIAPVVPAEWPGFTVRYEPIGSRSTYVIEVVNSARTDGDSVPGAVIDVESSTLETRIEDGVGTILLTTGGATNGHAMEQGAPKQNVTHHVRVTMGAIR